MNEQASWRAAVADDLATIVAVQDHVHTLASESRDVFAAKLQAYPAGCHVLIDHTGIIGYGIFHPWRIGDVPPLHALPFVLPADADCLFIHDVALLPAARGRGAVRPLLDAVRDEARRLRLDHLALVSVYDTQPFWRHLGFTPKPVPFDPAKQQQYGASACYMTAAVNAG